MVSLIKDRYQEQPAGPEQEFSGKVTLKVHEFVKLQRFNFHLVANVLFLKKKV